MNGSEPADRGTFIVPSQRGRASSAGDRAGERRDRDEAVEPRRPPEPLERRHEHPHHDAVQQEADEPRLEEHARRERPDAVALEHVLRRGGQVLGEPQSGRLIREQPDQRQPISRPESRPAHRA